VARARFGVRRSSQLAWFVTGPLAVVAVLVTFGVQYNHPIDASDWWLAPLYVALFAAAEATILRFEIRRQGFSASLGEIPLVLGLFYLAPLVLVLVRGAASLVVRGRRSQSAVKLWFNVASITAAAACASLVVTGLGPVTTTKDPKSWLILVLAAAASLFVTFASVVGVITLVQGRPTGHDLVRQFASVFAISAVNITLGLVVLLILRQSAWAVLLLAVLMAAFVMGYRSYIQFQRQHRSLTEMYALTGALREAQHSGLITDVLLTRVRDLMQAEYATLWLPAQGRHPEVLLSARFDDQGLLDIVATPDSLRRAAIERGSTVAIGPGLEATPDDAHLREELRGQRGPMDAIVVPLRSGGAVIGTLEVAGRLGDGINFELADVRLLETVAAHAAVAVENSRLVDRLRFDATHDSLTGLPNRRQVSAALEESVGVRAPGEVVAVLLFDVDGLRDVNESLGFAAGDKLLAEVARRLRTLAPPAALVGRVGGDEFAVLLRADGADGAVSAALELRERLHNPMVFDTLTLDVDTAVGVAVHPDHGTDPAALLQRADLATHAAKSVSSGVQLFNLALESRSARRLGLAGDLRRALDNDELEIYFQPMVALPDRRLVAVECLARWEHPTHGPVAPEDFVAVAEHTGQLGRLTEAVLEEALRRCREWSDAGRPLSVAVNLSPRTLLDPEFPARVERMLSEHVVKPERVIFEITEDGVLGETDRPMPTLRRLHDMGVRLAVDDFGTGYSSLSYLRRLPVDEVKIDRTFVQGMATDPGDLAIVRAVVDLARHFGLTVVAEGVESELTLELLEEIGCDIGQGFLFSRPLPYERLEAWFGAQTEAEPTPAGEVRRLRAVP
jgi:diguanylate cyclase (GGDEF)-like protein